MMLTRWQLVLGWFVTTAAVSVAVVYKQRASAVARFERDASDLHRMVAQRIDQHDAHLTALSALIMAADPPPTDAIKAVATNILQFYPRLLAIDVVAAGQSKIRVFTSRQSNDEIPAEAIGQAAENATSGAVSTVHRATRYLLVKRVPNPSTPSYIVALDVDADRLLSPRIAASLDVSLLSAVSGHRLYRSASWSDDERFGLTRLETRMQLTSPSQPLELWLRRDVPLTVLSPWAPIAGISLAMAIGLWLANSSARARSAEHAARLEAHRSAQEARLAQASRFDALGELSLGIAHELTQPLAALLSQSQAGLRIIRSGTVDMAAIEGVLDANARHAKRAGDLLAKLRTWADAAPADNQMIDLKTVIEGIGDLNRGELESRGIYLTVETDDLARIVGANQIAIEQIAQNLIVNARDACLLASPAGSAILIQTFRKSATVGFRVVDDGIGLADDTIDRLFDPFVSSSKPGGMGLGLAISRRLAERFSGEIKGGARADGRRGAAFTVVFPIAKPNGRG